MVVCALVFAVALFLPLWAQLDGPDTKYAGSTTAGVYALAGSGSEGWDELGDGGDAPAPGYVVLARTWLSLHGPVTLIALVLSAIGAFRRRAPASRWAQHLVDAGIVASIGFLVSLVAWGSSPHIAGFLAIAALVVARTSLGTVPLHEDLYPAMMPSSVPQATMAPFAPQATMAPTTMVPTMAPMALPTMVPTTMAPTTMVPTTMARTTTLAPTTLPPTIYTTPSSR